MTIRLMTIAVVAVGLCSTAFPQMQENTQPTLKCSDQNDSGGRLQRHCEMKEQTIAYGGRLEVDASPNGGVTIKGWSRQDVWVRMKVETRAPSQSEAQGLVGQIHLNVGSGRISADGPTSSGDQQWSVSYEVFVPHQANLSLKTVNGGVTMADVRGDIDFSTVNGGIHLARVDGRVHGQTTNGGVKIELAGSRWEGEGLDISTLNGGVNMTMPSNYSARLETSTHNGGMHTDFPMTVQGRVGNEISTNIGPGGARLHVTTQNGGVSITKI